MPRSAPVDGFSLTYDRSGSRDPVLLLHGWPGDRGDWRAVVPLVDGRREVVVPDLRGFGESDKHQVEPSEGYSASAQAPRHLLHRRDAHRPAGRRPLLHPRGPGRLGHGAPR